MSPTVFVDMSGSATQSGTLNINILAGSVNCTISLKIQKTSYSDDSCVAWQKLLQP
jgi:hypothetical protein